MSFPFAIRFVCVCLFILFKFDSFDFISVCFSQKFISILFFFFNNKQTNREAIKAANPKNDEYLALDLPLTSERIRMACSDSITKQILNAANVKKFKAKGSW